ncbi:hypothetical protein KKE58_02145, partial [Patescibacteria group bacterium]|nr:hypothetical protein [Patescibacteria group bacterium]
IPKLDLQVVALTFLGDDNNIPIIPKTPPPINTFPINVRLTLHPSLKNTKPTLLTSALLLKIHKKD